MNLEEGQLSHTARVHSSLGFQTRIQTIGNAILGLDSIPIIYAKSSLCVQIVPHSFNEEDPLSLSQLTGDKVSKEEKEVGFLIGRTSLMPY